MSVFSSLLYQSIKIGAYIEAWLHGLFRRSTIPRLTYHPFPATPLHAPKLITPIPYRDAYIQTSQGDEVHVRVWFSEGREKNPLHEASVILVFIPEAPTFIQHVNYVACEYVSHPKLLELAKNRQLEGYGDGSIVLIAIDLPGSGFSYASSNYRHTVTDGATVIIQVLDTLKVLNHHHYVPENIDPSSHAHQHENHSESESHNSLHSKDSLLTKHAHPKLIMIASSITGFYAMEACRQKPATFELLILSQTPSLKTMKQWYRGNYPFLLRIPILGQLISFCNESLFSFMHFRNTFPRITPSEHSPFVSPFTATALDVVVGGGCHSLSSVIQGTCEDWKVESERYHPSVPESVPVVGIWGCTDHSHKLANSEETSLLDDVEHAKVTTIKEIGHFAQFEVPNVVVELILQALNPSPVPTVSEEQSEEQLQQNVEESGKIDNESRVEELGESSIDGDDSSTAVRL
jgi:pimeloyl-ACP methyl ester carboxylesterase